MVSQPRQGPIPPGSDQFAIVSIAVSCTISSYFNLFDVEEYRDLEIQVIGIQ